mgnify:CR=1 FL=1
MCSLFALAALLPIVLVTALWNLMKGEHPTFYRQVCVGIAGKPFEIVKLATMFKDSPNVVSRGFVEASNTRLPPLVGLRKTKIN